MFSLVSVRPRGRRCTPPGQTPPTGQTNPLGRHPLPLGTPQTDTSSGRHTSPADSPADGYCSGRYASCWDTFLLYSNYVCHRLMKKSQTQDAVYCEHFKSSISLSYIFQFKLKNGEFHNFSFRQNGNVKLSLKERSKICSWQYFRNASLLHRSQAIYSGGIKGGQEWRAAPSVSIFFIFMLFSAKLMPNNTLAFPLGLAPT